MGLFNRKNATSFWEKKLDSMGPPLTKEQKVQVNAFLYTKPRAASVVTIAEMGYFPRFTFTNIPVLNWNVPGGPSEKRYMPVNENKVQAKNDIMLLDQLLKQAKYDATYKRNFKVIESEILFPDELNLRWDSGFSWLEICELTSTGKLPKYPVALHFYSQPKDEKSARRVSGTIYYLKTGEIGKFQMSRSFKDHRVDLKHTL